MPLGQFIGTLKGCLFTYLSISPDKAVSLGQRSTEFSKPQFQRSTVPKTFGKHILSKLQNLGKIKDTGKTLQAD